MLEPLLWDACQGGKAKDRCCEYAREFPSGKFAAGSAEKQRQVLFDCAVRLRTIGALTVFGEQNRHQRDQKTLQVERLLQDALYEQTRQKPSAELCEGFLDRFSEGTRAIQVREIMEPLLYAWAAKTATVEACEKYLQGYPDGRRAPAILGILEPALFKLVNGSNSIERYETYLKRFPKGSHVQEITSALD